MRKVLLAVFVVASMLMSVGGAFGHPCDNRPDDPRCTWVTTTTLPPDGPVIGLAETGSNGDRYWEVFTGLNLNYGGGDMGRWCDPTSRHYPIYWSQFEKYVPQNVTDIWAYWMARGSTPDPETSPDEVRAQADHCIEQLQLRRPDATIWLTGMADYAVPHSCNNQNYPERARWAVDYALATYPEVQPGPPHEAFTVVDLAGDGCHPGGTSLDNGATALQEWVTSLIE